MSVKWQVELHRLNEDKVETTPCSSMHEALYIFCAVCCTLWDDEDFGILSNARGEIPEATEQYPFWDGVEFYANSDTLDDGIEVIVRKIYVWEGYEEDGPPPLGPQC